MGPDGRQLGVDSGFVLSAVGLDKIQYFQNSLRIERSLAAWAEPGDYSQPREEMKGPSRLQGRVCLSHTVLGESFACPQPPQPSPAIPVRRGATH